MRMQYLVSNSDHYVSTNDPYIVDFAHACGYRTVSWERYLTGLVRYEGDHKQMVLMPLDHANKLITAQSNSADLARLPRETLESKP